jgi:hypothetical protein
MPIGENKARYQPNGFEPRDVVNYDASCSQPPAQGYKSCRSSYIVLVLRILCLYCGVETKSKVSDNQRILLTNLFT